MELNIFLILSLLIFNFASYSCGEIRRFPDNFQFGVATASYQIEGGWNASDKGENIWDYLTHNTDIVNDGSTGDIACDSYHKWSRDVEMLQELGVDFYRFSLSWSRLLPSGQANKISDDGVAYYNTLIDALIAANITPVVTLYHWDLPQPLQELLGGWTNPYIVDHATDYAKAAFELFGDRVKTWITINEPWVVCVEGYGTKDKAPAIGKSGTGDYLCGHNIIKAHAAIYHLYDKLYRPTQKGRIGISLNSGWAEPGGESENDLEASDRSMQFNLGWFAHPIFTKNGDYPEVMKEYVARFSANQGFPRSRLPEFTQEEIEYIRGTSDFLGLNHYTSNMVKKPIWVSPPGPATYWTDQYVIPWQKLTWPPSASSWLRVVPWGFTKTLQWIRDNYDNTEVIVTENGFSDRDGTDDTDRVNYYNSYLNAMLDAIEDGCNVSGYTAWSLMDNFEWNKGYKERFGLYYVDFNDPDRPRTPKKSAFYYKDILATRIIESPPEENFIEDDLFMEHIN